MESYDIVVIGSGPAGQKAAMQGAKLAQRVLVIEQDVRVRGAGRSFMPWGWKWGLLQS